MRTLWLMTIVLTPVVLWGGVDSSPKKSVFSSNSVGKSDHWFGKDKTKHFIGSLLSTGWINYISRYKWHQNRQESIRFSIGLTLSLGIVKEVKDSRTPGNFFSWKDLMADCAGITAGALLLGGW